MALVYSVDAIDAEEEERLAGESLDHGFEFVSNAESSEEDGKSELIHWTQLICVQVHKAYLD